MFTQRRNRQCDMLKMIQSLPYIYACVDIYIRTHMNPCIWTQDNKGRESDFSCGHI